MSSHRPIRALAVLAAGSVVALTAQATLFAAPAAALAPAHARAPVSLTAKPKKPKPFVLPKAVSWVGGVKLISTAPLSDLPPGTPRPPVPKAASWIVADLTAGTVLAGQNVHVPLRPASTLKIFTALALAPGLNPKTVYTGRQDDAAIDGTKVGIVPGSKYTVNDLLHGLLMVSGNDCANALANASGGVPTAVQTIQAQARALGAFDTVVRGPSGLDAKGQVSSAYDLALAGAAALRSKQLTRIMLTPAYTFPGKGKSLGAKRARFQTQNHNRMLGAYPGTVGVKNGFTTKARGTFVGAASRSGHTYLAVVMRSASITPQVEKLLDWAFANGPRARPVGILVRPGQLSEMTGPGIAEPVITPTPAATPSDGTRNQLRAALPTAGSSLNGPAAYLWTSRLWLLVAALLLVLIAAVIARRYWWAGPSRRGAGRVGSDGMRMRDPGSRVRLPGGGRHRS